MGIRLSHTEHFGKRLKEGLLDRQNLFPAIILFLPVCCFFIISDAFFLLLCIELVTWPLAKRFAGPYWKHVVFIPFFLFLFCCLPAYICLEAYDIKDPSLYAFFGFLAGLLIAGILILYLCGKKHPREGKPPSWPAYLLLVLPYPAWLLLFIFSSLTIHINLFDRTL